MFAGSAFGLLAMSTFALAQPNLAPYHPAGWSANVVVTTAPGSTGDVATDAAAFSPSDTLYLNWAVLNGGTTATAARFYVAVYVDGVPWNGTANFYDDPPLRSNYFGYWTDEKYGSLPAGTHTIKVVVDSTNAVAESNEADNNFTKTILVGGSRIKPVVEPSPVVVVGRGEKPVVVMDSASRNISASRGGTITLPSGSRVTFPPGLLSGDQHVTVNRLSALPDEPPSGMEVSAGPALEFEITVAPAKLSAPALFAATPPPTVGFSIALSGADLSDFEGALPLAEITLPSAGYTTYVGAQFGDVSRTQADIELPVSVIGTITAALSHPGSTLRVAIGVAQLLRLPGLDCGNRGPMRLDPPSGPSSLATWNPAGDPCAGESLCGKHILVLVHGILSSVENAFSTDRLCVEEIQRRGGYEQVFGFDYDYMESIVDSGEKFAQFLNALVACCPSNPPVIDIEAHSRGGLVTMAAVPRLAFTARNLVLLGSPLAGTDAAFVGQNFQSILAARGGIGDVGSFCWIEATLESLLASPHFLADMTPESTTRLGVIEDAARNPNYENLYMAAGTDGSSATGWIFGKNTPNDGVVTVESATGTGIPLKRTPGGTATFGDDHVGLECDPDVQAWVGGRINPADSVTIDSFRADPATIAPGESSLLSWTTTNATSVSINDGVNGLNGSMRVSPAVTTTYRMVAQGPAGTATAAATVTVNAASFSLSVSTTGSGSVTSVPAGISCGSTCSAHFPSGTSVKLTAVPAGGAAFSGWSGACSGTAATCTVAMSADKSVSARFTSSTMTFSGSFSGSGPVANTGDNCTFQVTLGGSITVALSQVVGTVQGTAHVTGSWSNSVTGGNCIAGSGPFDDTLPMSGTASNLSFSGGTFPHVSFTGALSGTKITGSAVFTFSGTTGPITSSVTLNQH